MKRLFYIILTLTLFLSASAQERYGVNRAFMSTDKYDEFSPAILNDRIVFCSNYASELFISYKGKDNMSLFNIFSVLLNDSINYRTPEVFSKNLITAFNDGPLAVHPSGNMVAYSRNIDIKTRAKNIFDLNNNLGIYFAELKEGEWTNITPFIFNDSTYSNTTPCFDPEGRFLYFASNMPGGFGGADIYRSELVDGVWTKPENLGSIINTTGNDAYPFISSGGTLFYSSDGRPGFGKKDIYMSTQQGTNWTNPLLLDAPINSKAEDFGIITDRDFTAGYFSSNRLKNDDIFEFKTLVPQLANCDTLRENERCYTFWDEKQPGIDSLPVVYEWSFSDGTIIRGLEVEHCFDGPGKYWAKLNIIDNTTSNTFFTQTKMEFELTDIEQPFITSRDLAVAKDELLFSGLNSNLRGFEVETYIWDFGDKGFGTGPEITHAYTKQGTYTVRLGLRGKESGAIDYETRCILKQIRVFSDNQALATHLQRNSRLSNTELSDYANPERGPEGFMADLPGEIEAELFRVEVLSSPDKILITDSLFLPLRNDYELKEYYLPSDSIFSYAVGEFESLLETYPVFIDVIDKGFTSATVKSYVIADLPVAVLEKINREFAAMADANFEFNNSEVSAASYHILDQIVEIMVNNPDIGLEIAAHTDNIGSFEYNMDLSTRRAKSIEKYLVSKGIKRERLVSKGYGESRPIDTNSTEVGRMRNRRVEFLILSYK